MKIKSIVHDVEPHFPVLTSYGKFTRHYISEAFRERERERGWSSGVPPAIASVSRLRHRELH